MRELSIREKLTKRTLYQAAVLGLVGGPIVWALHGCPSWGNLASMFAMAIAVPLVDAIRPTFVRN